MNRSTLKLLATLDGDDSTRMLGAIACRALTYHDESAAQTFVRAVLQITDNIEEAAKSAPPRMDDREADLFVSTLLLNRLIVDSFPEVYPPEEKPTAEPAASTPAPEEAKCEPA